MDLKSQMETVKRTKAIATAQAKLLAAQIAHARAEAHVAKVEGKLAKTQDNINHLEDALKELKAREQTQTKALNDADVALSAAGEKVDELQAAYNKLGD